MTGTVPLDRRRRRRQETIEEVLRVATEVMAEQGVAGLTLGEVARRMGIRPPSLYGYFAGKHALYDALFERGWSLLLAELRRLPGEDPVQDLHTCAEVIVRWSVEHPAYAPLMHWRPIPGFTPSEAAYAPAVAAARLGQDLMTRLQAAGVLPAGTDLDRAFRTWTVVVSGVVTQQLANAPGEPYERGTFTSTVPDVVAMWLAHHRAPHAGGGDPA